MRCKQINLVHADKEFQMCSPENESKKIEKKNIKTLNVKIKTPTPPSIWDHF